MSGIFEVFEAEIGIYDIAWRDLLLVAGALTFPGNVFRWLNSFTRNSERNTPQHRI